LIAEYRSADIVIGSS
jgi:hypothetical protein